MARGYLPVYMFAPETEKLLQNSLRQTPNGVFFALAPDATERFANTLRELENDTCKRQDTPGDPHQSGITPPHPPSSGKQLPRPTRDFRARTDIQCLPQSCW